MYTKKPQKEKKKNEKKRNDWRRRRPVAPMCLMMRFQEEA